MTHKISKLASISLKKNYEITSDIEKQVHKWGTYLNIFVHTKAVFEGSLFLAELKRSKLSLVNLKNPNTIRGWKSSFQSNDIFLANKYILIAI